MSDPKVIKQNVKDCLREIAKGKNDQDRRETAKNIAVNMLGGTKSCADDFLSAIRILAIEHPTPPVCALLSAIKTTMMSNQKYEGLKVLTKKTIMKVVGVTETAKDMVRAFTPIVVEERKNSWLPTKHQRSKDEDSSQADDESEDSDAPRKTKKGKTQGSLGPKSKSKMMDDSDSFKDDSSDDETWILPALKPRKQPKAKIEILDSEKESSEDEVQESSTLEVQSMNMIVGGKALTKKQLECVVHKVSTLVKDQIEPELMQKAKKVAERQVTKHTSALSQSMKAGFDEMKQFLKAGLTERDQNDQEWIDEGYACHPKKYTVKQFFSQNGAKLSECAEKYFNDKSSANANALQKRIGAIREDVPKTVIKYAKRYPGTEMGKFIDELNKNAEAEDEDDSAPAPEPKRRNTRSAKKASDEETLETPEIEAPVGGLTPEQIEQARKILNAVKKGTDPKPSPITADAKAAAALPTDEGDE